MPIDFLENPIPLSVLLCPLSRFFVCNGSAAADRIVLVLAIFLIFNKYIRVLPNLIAHRAQSL